MSSFSWDRNKEILNIKKHGVDFETAERAFKDPDRKIFRDVAHSCDEERYYCIGKVEGHILTIRFTYREHKIRIFGAGLWRKGKLLYEKG